MKNTNNLMEATKTIEKAQKGFEKHMRKCLCCKAKGRYNIAGGTTDIYHAFFQGYIMGREEAKLKEVTFKEAKR